MLEFIIEYWLEIAFGVVVSAVSFMIKSLYSNYKKITSKQKAIEKGVQALLRNELIRRYREYEEKGAITIIDKENIEHMYNEYKNLGGNGTVAKMYDDLMNLEIKIIKG